MLDDKEGFRKWYMGRSLYWRVAIVVWGLYLIKYFVDGYLTMSNIGGIIFTPFLLSFIIGLFRKKENK